MSSGKSGDKKALRNNTIALVIIQVLNYAIPFITLPYVSRIFDVDKFGVIFFAQSMIDYFYRFIMFGFNLSGVRSLAINRDNPEKVNTIVNSVTGAQLLFSALSFIVLTILIIFVPKFRADAPVFYFTFIGSVASIFIFTWFFQGMERMKFITFINIITRGISLVLIFTLIKKPSDYILYPVLNSMAYITAAIIAVIIVKKRFNVKFRIESIKNIWDSIKESSEFFISQIAVTLYKQTNIMVLGFICTTTVVAYYCAADKILWAIVALFQTFVSSLFPYMSKNKDITFFKKMHKHLIALCIITSLILIVLAKPIIMVFYSSKYMASVPIIQIFFAVFTFNILFAVYGYSLLGAFGHIKETNRSNIIGGIYNIIVLGILYLTNCINIYSIAILTTSTYMVLFLHRLYYVHKYKLLK